MKKLICTLLAFILMFGSLFVLSSCNDKDKDNGDASTEESTTASVEQNPTEEGNQSSVQDKPTGEPTTDPTDEPVTPPTNEPNTDPTDEPVTPPTNEPNTDPTDEPVTPPIDDPAKYATFENEYISFAYPEGWQKTEIGAFVLLVDGTTGNNISVAYEAKSDVYATMTNESFNTLIAPSWAAQGLTVSDLVISHVKNTAGFSISKFIYKATQNGKTMDQAMLVIPSGEYNYVVTVTEGTPVEGLLEAVFESLTAKKDNTIPSEGEDLTIQAPAGYKAYANPSIAFAYPENWVESAYYGMDLLMNEVTGESIVVTSEAFSDDYATMTTESFATTLKPELESSGMTISNATVTQGKNANGCSITKISYSFVQDGISGEQALLIVPCGANNWVLSVTMITPAPELVEVIFNSLTTKN